MSGPDAVALIVTSLGAGAALGFGAAWSRLGSIAVEAKAVREAHDRLLRTVCTLDVGMRREIAVRLKDIYEMDTGRDMGGVHGSR